MKKTLMIALMGLMLLGFTQCGDNKDKKDGKAKTENTNGGQQDDDDDDLDDDEYEDEDDE